jgi:tape measure domain-containing protein
MAANLKYTANEQKFVESMKKMAGSVGQLAANVNLKLNKSFKESDYLSRKLDQGFGKLGGQMKSFGRAMTIGVTLPLALAAKSASDAFAEYDSLRRALASYHPTLDGLNSRLAEMRTLAKLPGLGFQEAIQGDVRLQAVGISAKNSSKILREFANAIAQTGGGKAQLNEVTIQLGQMAAKGKVLNQDLRPIIESAPAVATALKSIFGTVSSEDISNKLTAAGKTSTEFIEMLLVEMEKAPRVTGGWKNSLENLSDALFISKSRIFEVANEVFNLESKVNSFSDYLENLVDGFTSLPQPLQAALLGLTAAAAIVPVLSYGIGSLVVLLPKLVVGIYSTTAAAGLLTLGLTALAAYFLSVRGGAEALSKELNAHKTAHEEAATSISAEVLKIEDYIKTLSDSESSIEDVTTAKNELRKIGPEFSTMLNNEKTDIDGLNGVLGTYKDRLLAIAEIKLLDSNLDKLVELKNTLKTDGVSFDWKAASVNKTASNWFSSMMPWGDVKNITSYGENVKATTDEQFSEINIAIDKNLEAQAALIAKHGNLEPAPAPRIIPPTAVEDASKAIKKFYSDQKALLRRQHDAFVAEMKILYGDIPEAPKQDFTFGKTKDATFAGAAFGNVGSKPKPFKEKLGGDGKPEAFTEFERDLEDFKIRSNAIMTGIGADFAGNLVQGLVSGNGIKGALRQVLSSLGDFMIQYGKKAIILIKQVKVLETALKINPAGGGAMAKAIGMIVTGGAMKGFASGVPALAQGGVTSNPTLAMIGDNSSGKEMVMPWEKTGDFASKIASDLGGGIGGGSMNSVLRGEDIYFSLERYKRGNN